MNAVNLSADERLFDGDYVVWWKLWLSCGPIVEPTAALDVEANRQVALPRYYYRLFQAVLSAGRPHYDFLAAHHQAGFIFGGKQK
jgi:hypothetical protein